MEWIAALGVAYGAVFLTAVPLRTVQYRHLFWTSFIVTYLVTVAVFYLAQLPTKITLFFGVAGALLGLILTLVRSQIKDL